MYKDRNAVVHGDKKDIELNKERIPFLENTVRRAIVKFLTLDTEGFPIGDLDALDDRLLCDWLCGRAGYPDTGDIQPF